MAQRPSQFNQLTSFVGTDVFVVETDPAGTPDVGYIEADDVEDGLRLLANSQVDKGTNSTGGATITFDVSAGRKQKLTIGANTTIAFSNWPSSGTYGEVEIELVNGGSATITWPTINWVVGDGTYSTTFADQGVTLQSSGTNVVIVWSTDGGTTLYGVAR
jgi:hypothetical protein